MRSGLSKSCALWAAAALCTVARLQLRVSALQPKHRAGIDVEGSRLEAENSVVPSSFSASSSNATVQDGRESVVCVISWRGAPCGPRPVEVEGVTYSDASCPRDNCCSKTACHWGSGCGNFCETSWALCSSPIVYHPHKSYGGDCNCAGKRTACHHNAECFEDLNPGGSVRCRCRKGFVGNGRHCEPDACLAGGNSRCGRNGRCLTNSAYDYTCECNEGYEASIDSSGMPQCTKIPEPQEPVRACELKASNCRDGECIDDPDSPHGYRCECKADKFPSETGEPSCIPTCQEQGGDQECRPGDCEAVSSTAYVCVCPEGYHQGQGPAGHPNCESGDAPTPEDHEQIEESDQEEQELPEGVDPEEEAGGEGYPETDHTGDNSTDGTELDGEGQDVDSEGYPDYDSDEPASGDDGLGEPGNEDCSGPHDSEVNQGGSHSGAGDDDAGGHFPGVESQAGRACNSADCEPGKCEETSPGRIECVCPKDYVKVYRSGTVVCLYGPQ